MDGGRVRGEETFVGPLRPAAAWRGPGTKALLGLMHPACPMFTGEGGELARNKPQTRFPVPLSLRVSLARGRTSLSGTGAETEGHEP